MHCPLNQRFSNVLTSIIWKWVCKCFHFGSICTLWVTCKGPALMDPWGSRDPTLRTACVKPTKINQATIFMDSPEAWFIPVFYGVVPGRKCLIYKLFVTFISACRSAVICTGHRRTTRCKFGLYTDSHHFSVRWGTKVCCFPPIAPLLRLVWTLFFVLRS